MIIVITILFLTVISFLKLSYLNLIFLLLPLLVVVIWQWCCVVHVSRTRKVESTLWWRFFCKKSTDSTNCLSLLRSRCCDYIHCYVGPTSVTDSVRSGAPVRPYYWSKGAPSPPWLDPTMCPMIIFCYTNHILVADPPRCTWNMATKPFTVHMTRWQMGLPIRSGEISRCPPHPTPPRSRVNFTVVARFYVLNRRPMKCVQEK